MNKKVTKTLCFKVGFWGNLLSDNKQKLIFTSLEEKHGFLILDTCCVKKEH